MEVKENIIKVRFIEDLIGHIVIQSGSNVAGMIPIKIWDGRTVEWKNTQGENPDFFDEKSYIEDESVLVPFARDLVDNEKSFVIYLRAGDHDSPIKWIIR